MDQATIEQWRDNYAKSIDFCDLALKEISDLKADRTAWIHLIICRNFNKLNQWEEAIKQGHTAVEQEYQLLKEAQDAREGDKTSFFKRKLNEISPKEYVPRHFLYTMAVLKAELGFSSLKMHQPSIAQSYFEQAATAFVGAGFDKSRPLQFAKIKR